MRMFLSLFRFEWQRFVDLRKLIIVIVFAVTGLYFVQSGISRYRTILENNRELAAYEREKPAGFAKYETYAAVGINLRLQPPAVSIFFDNNGFFEELSGKIDAAHLLEIIIHLKENHVFQERQWFNSSFSRWFQFIGSLMILFYGLGTFNAAGFLKSICSLIGRKKTFLYIVASRLIIISCVIAAVLLLGVALALINGVTFTGSDYLHLFYSFFVWILVAYFFFGTGMLIGLTGPRVGGGIVTMIFWVIMIFIIPMLVSQFSGNVSKSLPSNSVSDKQKWEAIRKIKFDFEGKFGEFKNEMRFRDDVRRFVLNAFHKELEAARAIEASVEAMMKSKVDTQQFASMFVPCTFFFTATSEISGKGLKSVITFFQFLQQFKEDFFFFFYRQKYYGKDFGIKGKSPVSFVKNTENIFHSKSKLPAYFWLGVSVSCLYITGFFLLSFFRLRKNFALKQPDMSRIKIDKIVIDKGKNTVVSISGTFIADMLYAIFSGINGGVRTIPDQFPLYIDDRKATPETTNFSGRFFYICPPDDVPGNMKSKDIVGLFSGLMEFKSEERRQLLDKIGGKIGEPGGYVRDMSENEKSSLLMEISTFRHYDLCIYHDVASGLAKDVAQRLNEVMQLKTEQGAIVIYLTRNTMIRERVVPDGDYIFEDTLWRKQLL